MRSMKCLFLDGCNNADEALEFFALQRCSLPNGFMSVSRSGITDRGLGMIAAYWGVQGTQGLAVLACIDCAHLSDEAVDMIATYANIGRVIDHPYGWG